jgi:hypothetical protein
MYRQFGYVYYNCKPPYSYTIQLGVILKREYPGLLQEKDEDGVLIREWPALDWPDYFLGSVNKEGMTNEERVLHEFWVRHVFLLEIDYSSVNLLGGLKFVRAASLFQVVDQKRSTSTTRCDLLFVVTVSCYLVQASLVRALKAITY